MKRLIALLQKNEDWLIQQILSYAQRQGYTKYTSTREEDWHLSINGINDTLIGFIEQYTDIPELEPDESFIDDPVCQFGIIEAQKHRARGITLEMFLGLFKYYKQSYHDLIKEQYYDQSTKQYFSLYIERCFDRIEIGFCSEWSRLSDEEFLAELQAENRELTNLKNKFLIIVESMFDPAILIDSDNKIDYVNSQGLKLFADVNRHLQMDQDQITGKKLENISVALHNALKRFQASEDLYGSDEVILEKNSENIIYQVQFSRMRDVSFRYAGNIMVLRDVTNEVESSLALEDSQRQQKAADQILQNVLDNIPMAVFWKDRNSVYLGCNKIFAVDSDIMEPSKIRGKSDFDLNWSTEVAEMYVADDKKVMESGIAKLNYEEPMEYRTKGETGWLRTSKIPLIEEDGDVYGVLGIYEDITESKTADEIMRKSESHLKEAEKVARIGHWELDMTSNELYLSDELYRLLQIDISESQPDFEKFLGFYGENSILLKEKMESTIIGRSVSIELPYMDRQAKKHWHYIHINYDKDFDGNVLKLFGTIQDVTDRKSIEEKLLANEQELQAANDELQLTIKKLGEWNTEMEVINKMGELLQACRNTDEAYSILAMTFEEIFFKWSGEIHVFQEDNLLSKKLSWGDEISSDDVFSDDDCWALRLGKGYQVKHGSNVPKCNHVRKGFDKCYMGVPLISLGKSVGVVHLATRQYLEEDQMELMKSSMASIDRILEQFGMTLSNLKLREELRQQSVQDPLTRLYNRRYMEKTLSREEHRVLRHNDSLAIIMIDLDHFKGFNDTHGHQAGDRALEFLGEILINSVRGEDVACRYGGEEFVLLLPGSDLESAGKRAEGIRQKIEKELILEINREKYGLTASIGVSVFPGDFDTVTDALKGADDALYHSKENGRNRVTVANK